MTSVRSLQGGVAGWGVWWGGGAVAAGVVVKGSGAGLGGRGGSLRCGGFAARVIGPQGEVWGKGGGGGQALRLKERYIGEPLWVPLGPTPAGRARQRACRPQRDSSPANDH